MLTKRTLLGAGSLGAVAAASSPLAFASTSPVAELPTDPAEQNKAFVKMIGSTAEDRVIWKSRGVIYAVQPDGIIPLQSAPIWASAMCFSYASSSCTRSPIRP